MSEELRSCNVCTFNIVKDAFVENGVENHRGYFHRWIEREIGAFSELLAVVEYEDGTIHLVNSSRITFTDRKNTDRVNIQKNKDFIIQGDICEFGKNEKVFIYVSLGSGKNNEDRYVEGFYLTGGNKGHIGRFNLKELRKTDKHFEIDNILKMYTLDNCNPSIKLL